jgi:CHAD domain-containing protein
MKIVERENKQELGSAQGGHTQPAAAFAETSPSIAIRRALARLIRKRVKKFVALAPQVSAGADPKIVHDARVWSRRVQQAVSAFFPKPRSSKVRRLRRTPRRIRRALGEWRNCDVLLEIIEHRQRRMRSEAKRRAWAFVRDHLLQKRSKEIARAGKKLLRHGVSDYAALAQRLLDQSPDEYPQILLQRLHDSVEGARTKWQYALSRAEQTRAIDDLHAFRVATKDLRYRTELLYDVGHKKLKAQLKWLAALQDALGVWHDRQVLHQAVAEAVARPDILLNNLPVVGILLTQLESDREHEAEDVEKIFRMAMTDEERKQMDPSSDNPLTSHDSPDGSGMRGEE